VGSTRDELVCPNEREFTRRSLAAGAPLKGERGRGRKRGGERETRGGGMGKEKEKQEVRGGIIEPEKKGVDNIEFIA
jgi:hypothetical protein